jgi:hypothetical protein
MPSSKTGAIAQTVILLNEVSAREVFRVLTRRSLVRIQPRYPLLISDYPVEAVSQMIDSGKRIIGTIMLNPDPWRMPSNANLK